MLMGRLSHDNQDERYFTDTSIAFILEPDYIWQEFLKPCPHPETIIALVWQTSAPSAESE
jgi:hypothetical protein